MTAIPKNPRVTELRELFRSLVALRATYEETGLEEVVSAAGNVWCLWDLEYLLQATRRLSKPQQRAITLCLVHNMREKDAAVAMGVSVTNPVMMYATLGLQRLLDMIEAGELTRFVERPLDSYDRARQHLHTVTALVEHIEKHSLRMRNNCLVYPTTCAGEAKLLVRSATSPLGYVTVSPMQLMFERYRGPVPTGCLLGHTIKPPPVSLDCVNPDHGELTVTPERKRELERLAARYNRMRRTAA
jgi:hypothetical protein